MTVNKQLLANMCLYFENTQKFRVDYILIIYSYKDGVACHIEINDKSKQSVLRTVY